MSAAPSTSTTHCNFASIFDAALESYKRKTKNDLASHPLLPILQSCNSPEAILTALREQIPASHLSQNHDDSLTKWVAPTVNVLHSFSETIGQGAGVVSISYSVTNNFSSNIYFQAFPPAAVIFTGIGILLSVGILHPSLVRPVLTSRGPRRPKMRALSETNLSRSLTALNISSAASRYMLASHQLRQ